MGKPRPLDHLSAFYAELDRLLAIATKMVHFVMISPASTAAERLNACRAVFDVAAKLTTKDPAARTTDRITPAQDPTQGRKTHDEPAAAKPRINPATRPPARRS